jgi:hypothetical protein
MRPIVKAASLKQLFVATKQAFMQLTGCTHVRFLLKHADLLQAALREHIHMESLKVELCKIYIFDLIYIESFSHVIINDNALGVKDDTSNFSLAFKELKDALRGFYKDRVYVWPFHKLVASTTSAAGTSQVVPSSTDEVVTLIVQLEIGETSRGLQHGGSTHNK